MVASASGASGKLYNIPEMLWFGEIVRSYERIILLQNHNHNMTGILSTVIPPNA